jgi:hypothetical protein
MPFDKERLADYLKSRQTLRWVKLEPVVTEKVAKNIENIWYLYDQYQKGEINLPEMVEKGLLPLGVNLKAFKVCYSRMIPRDLNWNIKITECTPRKKGFEGEPEPTGSGENKSGKLLGVE